MVELDHPHLDRKSELAGPMLIALNNATRIFHDGVGNLPGNQRGNSIANLAILH